MSKLRTAPVGIYLAAAATLTLCATVVVPQSKRSRTESDLTAIGHRNIAKSRNFYSIDQERKLGDQMAKEISATSHLLDDAEVSAYLQAIAQRVEANSDRHLPIRLHVVNENEVEAFTLAGGHQYISVGLLLRLDNQGELASAIARGIAHTAMRTYTALVTEYGLGQLAEAPAVGQIGAGNTDAVRGFAIPLTILRSQRAAESDADYFAVQYVYKSGYDASCYLSFLQKMWGAGAAADGQKYPAFSDYPPLSGRVQALKEEISGISPARSVGCKSSPDFQSFKEQLRAHVSQ